MRKDFHSEFLSGEERGIFLFVKLSHNYKFLTKFISKSKMKLMYQQVSFWSPAVAVQKYSLLKLPSC